MAAELKELREALVQTQKQMASQQQEIEALKQQLEGHHAAPAAEAQDRVNASHTSIGAIVPSPLSAVSNRAADAGMPLVVQT